MPAKEINHLDGKIVSDIVYDVGHEINMSFTDGTRLKVKAINSENNKLEVTIHFKEIESKTIKFFRRAKESESYGSFKPK